MMFWQPKVEMRDTKRESGLTVPISNISLKMQNCTYFLRCKRFANNSIRSSLNFECPFHKFPYLVRCKRVSIIRIRSCSFIDSFFLPMMQEINNLSFTWKLLKWISVIADISIQWQKMKLVEQSVGRTMRPKWKNNKLLLSDLSNGKSYFILCSISILNALTATFFLCCFPLCPLPSFYHFVSMRSADFWLGWYSVAFAFISTNRICYSYLFIEQPNVCARFQSSSVFFPLKDFSWKSNLIQNYCF